MMPRYSAGPIASFCLVSLAPALGHAVLTFRLVSVSAHVRGPEGGLVNSFLHNVSRHSGVIVGEVERASHVVP